VVIVVLTSDVTGVLLFIVVCCVGVCGAFITVDDSWRPIDSELVMVPVPVRLLCIVDWYCTWYSGGGGVIVIGIHFVVRYGIVDDLVLLIVVTLILLLLHFISIGVVVVHFVVSVLLF
jgi:hypothetical protein